jgi:hypothetical protein
MDGQALLKTDTEEVTVNMLEKNKNKKKLVAKVLPLMSPTVQPIARPIVQPIVQPVVQPVVQQPTTFVERLVAPSFPRNGTHVTRSNPRTSTPVPLENDGEMRQRPSELPFYAGSDKVLLHIGGYKYLVIQQSNGGAPDKLRICELSSDSSRRTVLIRLNLQQWVDMCYWSDTVNEIIEKERESEGSGILAENGRKRMHLGGNVYMTVKRGLPGIDFRWYWLPPDNNVDYKQSPEDFNVQPTRYGIWLTYREWYKLGSLRYYVDQFIPELEGLQDCPSQHFNQQGMLLCVHCNPNGHQAWM